MFDAARRQVGQLVPAQQLGTGGKKGLFAATAAEFAVSGLSLHGLLCAVSKTVAFIASYPCHPFYGFLTKKWCPVARSRKTCHSVRTGRLPPKIVSEGLFGRVAPARSRKMPGRTRPHARECSRMLT